MKGLFELDPAGFVARFDAAPSQRLGGWLIPACALGWTVLVCGGQAVNLLSGGAVSLWMLATLLPMWGVAAAAVEQATARRELRFASGRLFLDTRRGPWTRREPVPTADLRATVRNLTEGRPRATLLLGLTTPGRTWTLNAVGWTSPDELAALAALLNELAAVTPAAEEPVPPEAIRALLATARAGS